MTLGIIISISVITALGIAVVETPPIQRWLEEQRRKIAELLRSIGEDLDPQSRRAAEAFAFEGRTPANDEGLRREASASVTAASLATGRSVSNASTSTVRRIPVTGPTDPNEAEERKRKGREYLAKRNQQMYEMQQRRKTAKAQGDASPLPSPSFDHLVDHEGKLKEPVEVEMNLPSPPTTDPASVQVQEMKEVDRRLTEPLLMGESSSSSSGWQFGSRFANPFGDEYAIDRSITPKPSTTFHPEQERASTPQMSMPGSLPVEPTDTNFGNGVEDPEGLTYEEQLAIALSLSEQVGSNNPHTDRRENTDEEDADLRAAIQASLKDMEKHTAAHVSTRDQSQSSQPLLVDITPSNPWATTPRRTEWESLFDLQCSPSEEPLSLASPRIAPSDTTDDLYLATPELVHARLATLDTQQNSAGPASSYSSRTFDPSVDVPVMSPLEDPNPMDASLYTARSNVSPPPSISTFDHETPQLIDISEDTPQEGMRTPTSRAHSSFGFQTDSDSETFDSLSTPASRAQSRPRSEISGVELVELMEDSDIDMLSEEGDGIATPDSWSEVGSRDAESETEEDDKQQSRIGL